MRNSLLLLPLAVASTVFARNVIPRMPDTSPTSSGSNSSSTPSFSFDELWKLSVRFWDDFIYPANVAQAAAINSSLLADDCQGRVDVTRNFDGAELNTEYLFGLFAQRAVQTQSVSLLGFPISYEIAHFAANEHIASAATIVTFNLTALGVVAPVEIDVWMAFNAAGQVSQYDATFRRFDWLVDELVRAVMPRVNATTPAQAVAYLQRAIAAGICDTHAAYCNGTDTQYESHNACLAFLTQQTRFGAAYEWGRDTLTCRMVHVNMVPFRPQVHCPHIGPGGGGMCVDDMEYAATVLQPYFNIPFVPYGYGS